MLQLLKTRNKKQSDSMVTDIGAQTGGASAPPTKLLGEQPVHPAPQFFSVTYS